MAVFGLASQPLLRFPITGSPVKIDLTVLSKRIAGARDQRYTSTHLATLRTNNRTQANGAIAVGFASFGLASRVDCRLTFFLLLMWVLVYECRFYSTVTGLPRNAGLWELCDIKVGGKVGLGLEKLISKNFFKFNFGL